MRVRADLLIACAVLRSMMCWRLQPVARAYAQRNRRHSIPSGPTRSVTGGIARAHTHLPHNVGTCAHIKVFPSVHGGRVSCASLWSLRFYIFYACCLSRACITYFTHTHTRPSAGSAPRAPGARGAGGVHGEGASYRAVRSAVARRSGAGVDRARGLPARASLARRALRPRGVGGVWPVAACGCGCDVCARRRDRERNNKHIQPWGMGVAATVAPPPPLSLLSDKTNTTSTTHPPTRETETRECIPHPPHITYHDSSALSL